MIAYKFKVYLSSDKKVHREIRILSNQSFKELHHTMMKAYQLKELSGASFFDVDDKWNKKVKIALSKPAADTETLTMDQHTIGEYVEGKKSKFIYECKAQGDPFNFKLELIDTEKDIDLDNTGRFPKWEDTSGIPLAQKKRPLKPMLDDDDEDFEDYSEGDSFGKGFDDVKVETEEEELTEEAEDYADEPYEEEDDEEK